MITGMETRGCDLVAGAESKSNAMPNVQTSDHESGGDEVLLLPVTWAVLEKSRI